MISPLNKQHILQSVEDGLLSGGVHVFDTIDSTNDWSLAEIKNGRRLPFVCIADHQTKGRGRRGRQWQSPAGANIYMSVAWALELPAEYLSLLPLTQGVAVLNALNRIGLGDAWLKWPNDVWYRDKKIAGVLIEISGLGQRTCNAVIGIGLNYAMPEHILASSAISCTDIAQSLGSTPPDRNTVVSTVITEVTEMCRQYQRKALSIYDDIKQELDALTGREVDLHSENGEQVSGRVLGIGERGELRVLVNGCERNFSSVDVSLRGLGDGWL